MQNYSEFTFLSKFIKTKCMKCTKTFHRNRTVWSKSLKALFKLEYVYKFEQKNYSSFKKMMSVFGYYLLHSHRRLLMLLQIQPSKPRNQSVNGVIKRRPNGRTLIAEHNVEHITDLILRKQMPKALS